MNNISIFSICILLIYLKNYYNLSEHKICVFYKSLIIFNLVYKNNMINNIDRSPKILNKFFIPYYLYSITNHFKINCVDLYMIIHHLCALNFLYRNKYSPSSINLIHGNLVLADFPNVVSELYYKQKNINRTIKNQLYCDSFFILYKLTFGMFNSYLYCKYCLDNNFKNSIQKNIDQNQGDYHWDRTSVFTTIIMYLAIFFKIKNIYFLTKNKIVNKIYLGMTFGSFIFINHYLLISKNINIINKKLLKEYKEIYNKMSIINLIIYYHNILFKNNLLKKKYIENKNMEPIINKILDIHI